VRSHQTSLYNTIMPFVAYIELQVHTTIEEKVRDRVHTHIRMYGEIKNMRKDMPDKGREEQKV